MPRTTLTATNAPGAYAGASTAVTFTAADLVNLNQFAPTGRELLIIRNTAGVSGTWTATSIEDSFGRVEHITAETLTAGQVRVYGPTALEGWKQVDGFFYLQGSAVTIEFAVIRF